MEIKVGIPTTGHPKINKENGKIRLGNMLIGREFHWQRELSVLLPGRIEIIPEKMDSGIDPGFSVINHVPVEDYLACVVGSEMNPEAPIEFLKAHAIISRSWVMGKVLGCHPEDDEGRVNNDDSLIGWDDTASHHGFHVCSDDHCQRYQGYQPLAGDVWTAIRDTVGCVLIDKNGNIIDARFSKCCGGMTELFSTCWQDREMPGLKSFEDPFCDTTNLPAFTLRKFLKNYDLSATGGYRWKSLISKEEIRKNLKLKFGRDIGAIKTISPLRRGPSGRISLLRIVGDKGELKLGKELWIRRLLSSTHLFSSAFDVVDLGESVSLTGRGWGHGVGLCQLGAANMAYRGFKCDEILNFYYPDAEIGVL